MGPTLGGSGGIGAAIRGEGGGDGAVAGVRGGGYEGGVGTSVLAHLRRFLRICSSLQHVSHMSVSPSS